MSRLGQYFAYISNMTPTHKSVISACDFILLLQMIILFAKTNIISLQVHMSTTRLAINGQVEFEQLDGKFCNIFRSTLVLSGFKLKM